MPQHKSAHNYMYTRTIQICTIQICTQLGLLSIVSPVDHKVSAVAAPLVVVGVAGIALVVTHLPLVVTS